MTKRTHPDYVKMFQDSLNGFVQDLHPMGGMATAVITVVEMIDSEGKYSVTITDSLGCTLSDTTFLVIDKQF